MCTYTTNIASGTEGVPTNYLKNYIKCMVTLAPVGEHGGQSDPERSAAEISCNTSVEHIL